MTILGFDTSTAACSVALFYKGETYCFHRLAPRQHNELLLSAIADLLAQAGISASALTGIAFGLGPGSFMGVRLAATVAKGLAYALDVPVLPVSSLRILAQTAYAKHGCEEVFSAWDARMQELYLGHYVIDSHDIMQPMASDQLLAPKSCDELKMNAKALVGNAWQVYQSDFKNLNTASMCDTDVYPHAKSLLDIAKQADAKAWQRAQEYHPCYLRHAVR